MIRSRSLKQSCRKLEVMMSLSEKFTAAQLKILCDRKKINTDSISISKFKWNELILLWLSWKVKKISKLTSPLEDSGDVNVGSDELMMNVETPECNDDALVVSNV